MHATNIKKYYFFQEEEKKENNNENETKNEEVSEKLESQETHDKSNGDKSPVRTRSQNKMEPSKGDKPKPVKKTVTFGTVESCEDLIYPLKKLPKHHAPLIPIIKKKSALKQSEYSTFNSILKPAKLTDLSSKSTSEHYEGYQRKNLNPLSKPMNKFSQFTEGRCMSPPPRNLSPVEKESTSAKFVLPVRSAHSSRVIKPNKKFIDGEEPTSSVASSKVLKKPKLKRLVFNNLHDDTNGDENAEKTNDSEKNKEKQLLKSSNLFKDKTIPSFTGLGIKKPDLFKFEKEPEYHTEESNTENLEDGKIEPSKDDRTGHAMRKLMDISDASSSTSTSSGSESEESWDSDSPLASDDEREEREKPASPSPEKEKTATAASQLLRGKVIIREARLQLAAPAAPTGLDGPFSTAQSGSRKFQFAIVILFYPLVVCRCRNCTFNILLFSLFMQKVIKIFILLKLPLKRTVRSKVLKRISTHNL